MTEVTFIQEPLSPEESEKVRIGTIIKKGSEYYLFSQVGNQVNLEITNHGIFISLNSGNRWNDISDNIILVFHKNLGYIPQQDPTPHQILKFDKNGAYLLKSEVMTTFHDLGIQFIVPNKIIIK